MYSEISKQNNSLKIYFIKNFTLEQKTQKSIILLRPGAGEFLSFKFHAHSQRGDRGIKKAQLRMNKHRTLYLIILHRATEHVRTADSSVQTCLKQSRLSSPGKTDVRIPTFDDRQTIQSRA